MHAIGIRQLVAFCDCNVGQSGSSDVRIRSATNPFMERQRQLFGTLQSFTVDDPVAANGPLLMGWMALAPTDVAMRHTAGVKICN